MPTQAHYRLRAVVLALATAMTVIVKSGQAAEDAPLAVTAIEPNEAPPLAHIKLTGRGFRGTKKVWFVVGRLRCKEAKHRVLTDAELDVEAPEYFSPDLKAAILVETAAGMTVTLPRDDLRTVSRPSAAKQHPFVLVEGGGAAEQGGSYVTFIEQDGVVTTAGRVTLIAKGGRLDNLVYNTDQSPYFVFAEPGTQISMQARRAGTVHQVPHVYYSLVDSLFRYELGNEPNPALGEVSQAGAPHISAIKPNEGAGGDIVEIHGRGFLGTRSVEFVQTSSRYSAPFRVKSDSVLRVEVPVLQVFHDQRAGLEPVNVLVESPQGVAITVDHALRPVTMPNARHLSGQTVTLIGRGGSIAKDFSSGPITVVDDGGIFGGGGSRLLLVKNGGTILDYSARELPRSLYCEPDAKLSDQVRRGRGIVHVPKINVCVVDRAFNSSPSGAAFGRPR
jgi:hypothetical protein